MEKIMIGSLEENQAPVEPPQPRAEEIGVGFGSNKPQERKKTRSFHPTIEQPAKPVAKEEEAPKVSPETAKAEAVKPNIDRAPNTSKGKITRRSPRGTARPI